MGKSTSSMAIFNCYVSSPEGRTFPDPSIEYWKLAEALTKTLLFFRCRSTWTAPMCTKNIFFWWVCCSRFASRLGPEIDDLNPSAGLRFQLLITQDVHRFSSQMRGWTQFLPHLRPIAGLKQLKPLNTNEVVYQGDQTALEMRCLEMRQRVDGLEERLQLLSQQLEVPLVRWGWWHVITPMSWRKMEGIYKIHEIHPSPTWFCLKMGNRENDALKLKP